MIVRGHILLKKTNKMTQKEDKTKIKIILEPSELSEEEKEMALFDVFDLLLLDDKN